MIIKNLSAGENLEVADEAWEILREEGAIIEEVLRDDCDRGSPKEKVDEGTTSPSDAVVGTSFNEKSDTLHGHHVVDIYPDEHPPGDEDGEELL